MASAVVKSGEHARSEKLESISGASVMLSISSAEVICEYSNKKQSEFLIIWGECKTVVSVLMWAIFRMEMWTHWSSWLWRLIHASPSGNKRNTEAQLPGFPCRVPELNFLNVVSSVTSVVYQNGKDKNLISSEE